MKQITKTLTEQWREGTLPEGYYYISFDETDNNPIIYNCTEYRMNNCRLHNEEVLAPVPSYDEYNQLVSKSDKLDKKLEIAIKALKKYESAAGWGREAFLALKEIEGVK